MLTSVCTLYGSGVEVKSLSHDTLIRMLMFFLRKVDKRIQDFIVTCAFITAAIVGKEILKRPPKYD